MVGRILRCALAVLALSIGSDALLPAIADAHARVVETQPTSGAAVRGPVTRVAVTFDEAVSLVPHALAMTTDVGVPVALAPARLGAGDTRLTAVVQDRLAPGRYAVAWRVEADDGHVETGTFRFSVVGDLAPASPGQALSPQAPDQPIWPVLVAAGVAIAAGLGAGLVVRRGLRDVGSAHMTQKPDR